MSVEEARENIIIGLEWHAEDRVDRLILEVRAEMPCHEWDHCELRRRFADQPDTLAYYEDDCSSCAARRQLVGQRALEVLGIDPKKIEEIGNSLIRENLEWLKEMAKR